MDYVLLAFCGFGFLKGYFKGFLSMIFSLIGTFFVVVSAWKLSELLLPYVQNFAGEGLLNFLKEQIDSVIDGKFSDVSQLKDAISISSFNIFAIFLFKLLGDLSFDGDLSAGQILAPSISNLLLKVLVFIFLFVSMFIVLNIIKIFIKKIVQKFGLGFGNRVLGGIVGLAKAIVLFAVFYFVMSALSQLLLNEKLLSFVENGIVSKFLYNNFILKIINLIY